MEKIRFFNFLTQRRMYCPTISMKITFLGFFNNVTDKSINLMSKQILVITNFYYKLIGDNICAIGRTNGTMSDINLSQASPSSILDISNLLRQKKINFPSTIFPP